MCCENSEGVICSSRIELGMQEELDPLGVSIFSDPVECVFDFIWRFGADGDADGGCIAS